MTLNEHIKKLKQELAELKAELNKPKQFEFEWKANHTFLVNSTHIDKNLIGKENDFVKAGIYRKTSQGAILSLARNKQANRLEMLVEYLGGLKEFKINEPNWYICYKNNEWNFETASCYYPGMVYMTEKVAEQVCNILNAKEYTL